MRFNYVVLLSVFIYMVWASTVEVPSGGAGVFGVSRMAEAGAAITATIVWFQFVALPLLAVVMLSTSISEEVTSRTLGVLMTTPINSFHIVMGKLLSKLLQLVILLGISLPLLAVVRVFGGIAWEYVLAGLSITLTTMLLAASVSLFFSIYHRKSQIVVSRVLMAAGLVYGLLPLLVELLDDYAISDVLARIVAAVNPFWLMMECTEKVLSPGGAVTAIPWFWHCLISIGITLAFILLATRVVRRVGRRQITGQEDAFPRILKKRDRPSTTTSSAPSGTTRTVKGHPVIWKERCIPILKGNRFKVLFMPFLTILSLLIVYGYCFYKRAMDEQETQIGFVLLFLLLVLMRTALYGASSITQEKERHTWLSLLSTPIDHLQIAWGKVAGSALRVWPFWVLLLGHLIGFSVIGYIHPLAVIMIALLALVGSLFFGTIGVMLSATRKKSSTAEALTIATTLVVCIPMCLAACTGLEGVLLFISPIVFGGIILLGTCGDEVARAPFRDLEFPTFHGELNWLEMSGCLLLILIVYAAFSLLCLALTRVAIEKTRK
jgi:ABC-type transport system involved in multi-copper enzyme maturation permease subunit